jgi:phage-related protein
MKLLAILLIAILASFSFVSAHRIRKSSVLVSGPSQPMKDNKYYQLLVGFIVGVADLDPTGADSITECVPPEWAVANGEKASGTADNADANAKSTLTTVLDFIEKIIDFVCKWKANLVDLIKGKRFRRYQRLFLQNEKSEIQKMLGWWSDAVNAAKNAFNSAKDTVGKIVTTVTDGIQTAGQWLKKQWNDLKNFANDVCTNLTAWWTSFKARAVAIFKPIYDKIVWIYNCFKTAKAIVKALIDVVKGIADKAQKIARVAAGDVIALAEIFLDLVCNFGRFRKAFNALASGMEAANIPSKYNYYGVFGGHLVAALTT